VQLSREIAIFDMATFGGFYVDQENMVPGLQGGQVGRRMAGKNVALKSVGLGEQRSALGEITNVTTRRVTAGKSSKQGGSVFPIFCDELPDEKNWRKNAEKSAWRSTNEDKENQYNDEKNSWRSKDENCAPVAAASRPLQRNKATACLPSLVDKENVGENLALRLKEPRREAERVVKDPGKVQLSLREPLRGVVAPPILRRSLIEEDDPAISSVVCAPMDDVDVEDEENSPMVVDTSQQQLDWRVPENGEEVEATAEISLFPEYEQDVFFFLRSREVALSTKCNYMDKQPDITTNMRQILVDWLVEVSEEYKLQTETLHLAVNYIDRFLSLMSVQRSKLQLVGTAAMFIASKYEEIYPPDVSEFVYITDDTYTKRQVLRMEHLVLKVLEFELGSPTMHLFASKMSAMAGSCERTTSLSMYLVELSLMNAEFLNWRASMVAAAAVALSRHTLGYQAWPSRVEAGSGYTLADIHQCLLKLHQQHVAAEEYPQQAMREKYKDAKHHGVSDIQPAVVASAPISSV